MRATYVTQAFAPHTHEGFAFGVIEAGCEGFHYRGALRIAPPGTVIALDPDEIHTGQAADGSRGWAYRMIYVPVDLVRRAATADLMRNSGGITFRSPLIEDADLSAALLYFHRTAEAGDASLQSDTRLIEILARLVYRHAAARSGRPSVSQNERTVALIRDYLETCFRSNVTLAELAAVASLSPFHLAHVFRATVGMPPHRYLEQVRVRRARALLAAGARLSDAAYDAGVVDQSHMTRHFKRHVGVTPGAYRRAMAPVAFHKHD